MLIWFAAVSGCKGITMCDWGQILRNTVTNPNERLRCKAGTMNGDSVVVFLLAISMEIYTKSPKVIDNASCEGEPIIWFPENVGKVGRRKENRIISGEELLVWLDLEEAGCVHVLVPIKKRYAILQIPEVSLSHYTCSRTISCPSNIIPYHYKEIAPSIALRSPLPNLCIK